MKRRELLAAGVTATGLALLQPGHVLGSVAAPVTGGLVIDGLSIAFNVTEAAPLETETLAAIRASGITAINMTTPYPGDGFVEAVRKISRLQQVVSEYPQDLMIVRTVNDIKACLGTGQMGVIIGFQSTEMLDESLQGIAIFHDLGARIMQMTYNGPGLLGNGCLSKDNGGLTEVGKAAIEQFNAQGVLIDASHANQATTAETIVRSEVPIVISHTGCNTIYRHPRNNEDADLKMLADKGGVAGIYLMPFLDGGTGELTPEMFFLHLEHALNTCGEDHVGIGSDQGVRPVDDSPEYRAALRQEVEQRIAAGISAPGESADRPPFIPAFNQPRRFRRIAEIMAQRGHSPRVIEKVMGDNFYRVMEQAW